MYATLYFLSTPDYLKNTLLNFFSEFLFNRNEENCFFKSQPKLIMIDQAVDMSNQLQDFLTELNNNFHQEDFR